MSDAVQRAFERLRREYLAELPARLDELEAAARMGDGEALRTGLHQLAGSGGSHGFPDISAAARDMEQSLAAGAGSHPDFSRLRAAVQAAELVMVSGGNGS